MTSSVTNLGIDGLEDVEQIGTGGSSRVYRARQVDLDRVIAVKVLNLGTNTDVARRFDRERKAMGRLSLHDGIVPVYSTGRTAHGEPYLVMPYYPNGSLQDLIDSGAMEWQTALRYVDVAAETIAAAHDAGVVHLDLKPANILLTRNGSPRIADFGIAKITGSQPGTTQGTAFTPAYSAPETFLDGETTASSDVYGLGATLWALLVGHPPFLGPGEDTNLMAVIGRVVNTEVGDLRRTTPPPVCAVIEKAMAKKPEDRYQTARGFSTALKEAARAASASAPSPGLHALANGTSKTPTVPQPAETQPVADSARVTAPGPGQSNSPYSEIDHRFEAGPVPGAAVTAGGLFAPDVGDATNQLPNFASPAGTVDQPPMSSGGRSLLMETAEPTALPLAVDYGPSGNSDFLDRFRLGPLALGAVALIVVFSAAVWILSQDNSDPATEGAAPAGPEIDGLDNPSGGLSSSADEDAELGTLDSSNVTESSADFGAGSDSTTASSAPTSNATSSTARTNTTTATTGTTSVATSTPTTTPTTAPITPTSVATTTPTTAPTTPTSVATSTPTTTPTTAPTTPTSVATTTPTTAPTTPTSVATTTPTTAPTTTPTTAPPTTPDPPGRPRNLSATAGANGTSVTLSWAPGTGAEPEGYVVRRNSVVVARPTTPGFTDRGLEPGLYSYSVTAVAQDQESIARTATVTVGRDAEITQLTVNVVDDVLRVSFATDQCVSYRIGVIDLTEPRQTIRPAIGPTGRDCVDSAAETFDVDGLEYQVNLVVQNANGDSTTRSECTPNGCP